MFLLALLACGGAVTIDPGQDGCTNVDLDDPDESKLLSEPGEGLAKIIRTNGYLEQSNLVFDPAIVAEDRVIHVREAWTESEEVNDTPFCYAPYVEVSGGRGDVQVRWYLEGEETPFDTVAIEL